MVLSKIEHKVDESMNDQLMASFTDEDIALAVKQMHPTKTLGTDRMSPIFYQKFWHIIDKGICAIVKQALYIGMFPKYSQPYTYHTFPKKKCA